MGVINGTFEYNCSTNQTKVVINTGPGTPEWVDSVNFKLNGVKYTGELPNDSFQIYFPGKVDSFKLTRIEFVWFGEPGGPGPHYANHPDTDLVNKGIVVSCPTTTTSPATTSTSTPSTTSTTQPENVTVCSTTPNPCEATTTTVNVPVVHHKPSGGNLPATGTGLILVPIALIFIGVGRRIKKFANVS